MRYCRASFMPEENLLGVLRERDKTCVVSFLRVKNTPYVEDEEGLSRFVGEKFRRASPMCIGADMVCSETIASSESSVWSYKKMLSAVMPKGISPASEMTRLLMAMYPVRKLSTMLMSRFFVLHFILLSHIYLAKVTSIC